MRDCNSCARREWCDLDCLGYVESDKHARERAEAEEARADFLQEFPEYEECVPDTPCYH